VIDAASEQDVPLGPGVAPIQLGLTAARVAQLHGQGKTPMQISRQLGLAKSTVSHHLKRLGIKVGRGYVGRRVVVEILGYGGPRASDLCDLKIGQVRLHDPDGGRFRIPDAKTETGVREVQMTPDLVETVIEHIDRLRRMGAPTGPDLLDPGVAHPLAPEVANEFDVKWVMSQVGHADSKMTMDVYAQLQQRAKRDRGAKFDTLVRDAREQLLRPRETPVETSIGTTNGTKQQKRAPRRARRGHAARTKHVSVQLVWGT
jgi:DNA-binding transcriptional ArsR family regulator